MPLTYSTVDTAQEIARAMVGVVEQYYLDLSRFQSTPILEFYRRVRAIPYCVEFGVYQNLQRPGYTLNGHGPFTACANKAIAIASYLKLKQIPYRFKIVSDEIGEPFHHVFAEGFFDGNWVPMDATYPDNVFGQEQNWISSEVIYP
jgi:hypothetical protein